MRRPALLLAAVHLAVSSGAAFTPRRFISSVSASTRQLVEDQKGANAIRKRRKGGAVLDYGEFDALQCANADVGKAVNLVWLALYAKFYTPLAIYFYPGMLPASYETPTLRARRLGEGDAKRSKGLLNLLGRVDAAAAAAGGNPPPPKALAADDVAAALAALGAASKKAALRSLVAPRPAGAALPTPALKCASAALEGPYGFLPRWMHSRAVDKGLKTLVDGDDALRATPDLAALSRTSLENACAARCLPRPSEAAMASGLEEWLKLTAEADASDDAAGRKSARLALLAVNAAAAVRARASGASPGVALLYAGKGY